MLLMKRFLLSVLFCAFAVSFSPVAMASSGSELAMENLPFLTKKKKGSKAKYKHSKRNETHVKKSVSRKKRKSVY
ncbi:hypothetical protein [Rufibacter sp. XAAS-G3-1]|uniref:hypothetical protein n=1 Tax=Rufibacter sp. XAAS-G3-1 TaxID=2729134 RepID=UPI0015E66815|nr:hypothetical protein [Rufibacter sp. XAAS-G3-1]